MMKRFLFLLAIILVTLNWATAQKMLPRYNQLTNTWTSYPLVTIQDIQYVPYDSLVIADSLQLSRPDWASLQYSSYVGDTVTVVALCVIPSKIIGYTQNGYTMVLYDTGQVAQPWGGIFVRCTSDTIRHIADGFRNVERGNIITITGVIQEFPTGSMNSITQFQPIPGIAIDILAEDQVIPPAIQLPMVTFTSGGKTMYTTGEQYECLVVEFHDLIVVAGGNATTGTFRISDGSGIMQTYDMSDYFTLRRNPPDNSCPYFRPAVGTVVDTIRGLICVISGGDNPMGYLVAPLLCGDIVYGNIKPLLTSPSRTPMIVEPTTSPLISVRAVQGTFPIDSVVLHYAIGGSPQFFRTRMTYSPSDTLYKATIPQQPANTFVRYFMKVFDDQGTTTILASFATGGHESDTSKGFFFYRVKSPPLTIYDIQYTPFSNGYSQYAGVYPGGAIVSVSGIVTADSTDMRKFPKSTVGGTWAYYMQSGNQPWNGIWITGPDTIMRGLRRGDSITVRGTVQEWPSFNINVTTRIAGIDSVIIHSSGNPIPAPILKPTAHFGSGVPNGSPLAEPFEGMLVKFQDLTVTDVWPYFSDQTQYEIMDGSGGRVWVHRDGTNTFSNQPGEAEQGYNIIYVNDKIKELTGIIHFSVNRYKFVPRSNADFGPTGTAYNVANRWNMMSIPKMAIGYTPNTLFPTATSLAWKYQGGSYQQYVGDLEVGMGFWLKFGSAQEVLIPGLRVNTCTVSVERGWNILGTVSFPVDVASITTEPADLRESQFFGYNLGYFVATTLQPRNGYWVKAKDPGYIYISPSFTLEKQPGAITKLLNMNSITITDNNGYSQTLYFGQDTDGLFPLEEFSMPPLPPSGTFDARYASHRIAEIYPQVIEGEEIYPIILNSPNYPLTITWNIQEDNLNHTFSLEYGKNKSEIGVQRLQNVGSAVIKNAQDNMLKLKVSNGEIPKEFALGQNYPNPFNPSTKFVIALPKYTHVEVVVYDILGRKVKTLVNGERSEGYHIITWDGQTDNHVQVGSGVYFVRMQSEKFNAVRKILMMK